MSPLSRKGSANANWRGGRRRGGQGMQYWLVHVPGHPKTIQGGYVLEHRLIVENHLGRYLEPHEIVHHKDGDTLNNDIANLELMTQAEHAKQHAAGVFGHGYVTPSLPQQVKRCEQCGSFFEAQRKKDPKRFCSQQCYWDYRRGRRRLIKGEPA